MPNHSVPITVFVTGATGYIGRPLMGALLDRGHNVHALVRPGSTAGLPSRAVPVMGDALDAMSYAAAIPPRATLVHLIGTPHPNPAKAAAFRSVDLVSICAAVAAGQHSDARHMIYVSVAHPAPVMHAYIAVRKAGEDLLAKSGIPATILRPWYVLGPGRRWPCVLLPFYALFGRIPATRATATRLAFVTLQEMVATLVHAVENSPPAGVRIMDVPAIRRIAREER